MLKYCVLLLALLLPGGQSLAADPPVKTAPKGNDQHRLESTLNERELTGRIVELIKGCKYAEAIAPSNDLVNLCERKYGASHEITATAINNVGYLYQSLGQSTLAEPLFQKALKIREQTLGVDNPDVALTLNNLALIYQDNGDFARAEELYLRSLAIKEKNFGARKLELAIELNNLATLYKEKGDYDSAEKNFQQVLSIFESSYPADDARIATVLNNLAGVYRQTGKFRQAEELYKRLMSIDQKVLPAGHLDRARDLNNVGVLYYELGRYQDAEPLYKQALSIREQALGSNHPDIIPVLDNLALLYLAKGDAASAIEFQTRANEISERNLTTVLDCGSENQKRLYLASLASEVDATISLNMNSKSSTKAATSLALNTVLRRKGRVIDVVSSQLKTLSQHLAQSDRLLLEKLSSIRSQLSTCVLHGAELSRSNDYLKTIGSLQAQVDQLESEISSHCAEFRTQTEPVTVATVQKAIRPDCALVEFVQYRLLEGGSQNMPGHFGAFHYAAYCLGPDGDPAVVDLGAADEIDKAVTEFRQSLRHPMNGDVKEKSRALYLLVMRPLRQLLPGKSTLLLSPDGALNLLPFAALLDEREKYLLESYAIDYLTSGRDLLRMNSRIDSRAGPVIVANPHFDLAIPGPGELPNQRTAKIGYGGMYVLGFAPLKGTAIEAAAIAKFLPGVEVLGGLKATEAAVKALHGPTVLHIATHGFFLPERTPASTKSPGGKRSIEVVARQSVATSTFKTNPLLRSGLALAGVERSQSGPGQDGLLTAMEVSGLDLWGTQLVVLSACDTGLGEVKIGEGVYGLRRALLIAGTESEVISLWAISDRETASLMTEYYKLLSEGKGRIDALRQAQLSLLKSKTASHPYYWAAFVPSGDGGPLRRGN